MKKIPIIDVTDLYHPHQDPGDNLDMILPFALPEIDVRAVVLDVTDRYRRPYADHSNPFFRDPTGPREAGFIPMLQLNYIFDKNVPFAVSPFQAMQSPEDKMLHVPSFQQQGIELILQTLRNSEDPVEIVSFGSTRSIAAAYNRDPELMKRKVTRLHISAGSSSPHDLEWNVQLDVHGFVCLLRSDLNIALYPCATENGPFAYGPNNTYWLLNDLEFIRDMHPLLQGYLVYALERSQRADFLSALHEEPEEDILKRISRRKHNVWETAVWAQVLRRSIVRRIDGSYRLVPNEEIAATDVIIPNHLHPCKTEVSDDGMLRFQLTTEPSKVWMFERQDPALYEMALREALPALYRSFQCENK